MKKIITILVIALGFSLNTFAQTNDATWEETVEFISENLIYSNESYRFEINQKSIVSYNNYSTSSFKETETLNLDKIEYVTVDDRFIKLHSIGKSVISFVDYYDNREDKNGLSDVMLIYFKDTTTRLRVFKAFQHLAYLAKQKRAKSKF